MGSGQLVILQRICEKGSRADYEIQAALVEWEEEAAVHENK